jgi:U3 small nucleolar RNA-associated protein 10
VPGAASAFYAVLLTESLAAMPRVTAAVVPRLLPYLEAGLAPAASAEQYAGALIVATQLASRAPLAPPLTEALLEVGRYKLNAVDLS